MIRWLLVCIFSQVLAGLNHHVRFRPIVLIHGINSEPRDWDTVKSVIRSERPSHSSGLIVELASPFDGVPGSWISLQTQVAYFRSELDLVKKLQPAEFREGFDLVCHSQGALTCRALVQEVDGLGVSHLVSLAGPQVGVFGEMWLRSFPQAAQDLTLNNAWKLAYEKWAQLTLSPANMWNDPKHHSEFLTRNLFLPKYLGYTSLEEDRERRKRNFLTLRKASFVVGVFENSTDDMGIDPALSGVFGFYNRLGVMESFKKQPFFKQDSFGLRTLHKTGRLFLKTYTNVRHDDWIQDPFIIREFVMPLLSPPREVGSDVYSTPI